MISKSEVIIADKLHNNKIQYAYEAPISDEKGVTIHPDLQLKIVIWVLPIIGNT